MGADTGAEKIENELRESLHGGNREEELQSIIEMQKTEIGNLKKQLSGIRTSENLIIKAAQEAFKDTLKVSVPKFAKKSRGKDERALVLHLSDVQVGKVTETYDASVAQMRVMECVRQTVDVAENLRKNHKVNVVKVYLGGDMVEGETIFPDQPFHIDQGVFEQAVNTAPLAFTKAILYLLEHFSNVDVRCVVGNHGRPGARSSAKHPKTNWDRVLYRLLESIFFGNDVLPKREFVNRLSFEISDTFYLVDRVFGFGNLLVHGHQVKGWASFPWYGTWKKAFGWADSIGDEWRFLYMGHFHTYTTITMNRRIVLANGSTESSNEYALETMAAVSNPVQRLAVYRPDKLGYCMDIPIFLD